MKVVSLFYVFVMIILLSCSQEEVEQAGREEILLSGDDWTIIPFSPGQGLKEQAYDEDYPQDKAIAASVPGDIHWDLERSKIIPELYYGTNTLDARWVTGKEWWYRKSFRVSKEWKGKTIRLRFDAVDYETELWLNNHYLGQHEGQFTAFDYNISEKLLFEDENILSVLIHQVPDTVRKVISNEVIEEEVMGAMRPAYPYWKSMTSSGWDWGADLVSMGIWQDVRLIATEGVYASNLTVLPEVPSPYTKARLHIKIDLHSSLDKLVKLTYTVKCLTANDEAARFEREANLIEGEQGIASTLEIEDPHLWWPNGYGEQHMYELQVTVRDAVKNTSLDQLSATFGIRELKMLENPKSPEMKRYKDYSPFHKPGRVIEITDSIQPPPYLIQINGRRILGMGANWLPCDLLFGRPDKEFYEHLISLAARANFNLFRIWGGGIIEKQIFFDLCDQYGIMLFAEFPNGGPRLPETNEALKIAALETYQLLPLMMNHPSVVRYGGGNEWYTNAGNSRQMAQLRQICNEVDPTRPFHDSDPETIGQRHGTYGYIYDTHYRIHNTGYPLWAGPDDPIEWTEYGSSGASSIESLKRIMPEENLWPIKLTDPYWIWHKGAEAWGPDRWLTGSQYTLLFGQLPDLETTVRCSQFVQAEGLRYANQSMRRHQWHRSAFTSWTYNEPWPNAAHGCIVEYYGKPKMAYYYARQSCAPVDVSCVYPDLLCGPGKPLELEVWVSNILSNNLNGHHLKWRIYNTSGQLLLDSIQIIHIKAEASEMLTQINWEPTHKMEGDVALLYLEILDKDKETIAANLYTFGINVLRPDRSNVQSQNNEKSETDMPEPILRALLEAKTTSLNIKTKQWHERVPGRITGNIEVENTGSNPALFTEIDIDVNDDVKIYYTDNYFFIPPGEKRLIHVTLVSEKRTDKVVLSKIHAKAWNSSEMIIDQFPLFTGFQSQVNYPVLNTNLTITSIFGLNDC